MAPIREAKTVLGLGIHTPPEEFIAEAISWLADQWPELRMDRGSDGQWKVAGKNQEDWVTIGRADNVAEVLAWAVDCTHTTKCNDPFHEGD